MKTSTKTLLKNNLKKTANKSWVFKYFFSKELFHLSFGLDIYEFSYIEEILYFQFSHGK